MNKDKNLKSRNPLFWKSLRDRSNDESMIEAKQNEFLNDIEPSAEELQKTGLSRRKFLALSAATTALAATACTDYRDKGEIVAYNKKPENVLPGIANYYASTCSGCSLNCGILIKTRAGRPIKIDGNPSHPVNKGKICSAGQASLMNLYSPERIQFPLKRHGGDLILFKNDLVKARWSEVDEKMIKLLSETSGKGKEIAIVAKAESSPTEKKLFEEFKSKYPTAKFYTYQTITSKNRIKAWNMAYGTNVLPIIKWDEADLILSFEGDFLGNELNFVENIRKFASKRNVEHLDKFNRLYAIEGNLSLTGMNADYRIRLNPVKQYDLLMGLINEIGNVRGFNKGNVDASVLLTASKYNLKNVVEENDLNSGYIKQLVNDLLENAGRGIVYAGNNQSVASHSAVIVLNQLLGNTALYSQEKEQVNLASISSEEDLRELINKMSAGEIDVVIHYDSNPVFELPGEHGYANALKKVKHNICLLQTTNETSFNAEFILPIHHDLESWNDYKTRNGIVSLQQPVINPLYKNRQKEAILLQWMRGKVDNFNETIYHDYLLQKWKNDFFPTVHQGGDFKTFWFASLHDGVVEYEEPATVNQYKLNSEIKTLLKSTQVNGFTILLSNNYSIGADGKNANNGWLQELPHPVSKVNWDNYAAISPKTAKKLGVDFDDLLEVNVNGKIVKLPVVLQPGVADDFLAVELGYGRTAAGEIGNNVGVNVNVLIGSDKAFGPYILTGIKVGKAKGRYKLASTQEHHMLDDASVKDQHKKRFIIREGTLQEYKENPKFLDEQREPIEIISLYPPHEYKEVKWAMSIDLNKCIGCTACVASCNVENNIPIVGKEQTMKGREMQWMRIDRYYSGTEEEPEISNQPMLCQQCDNAPCENVCPVAATNHSPDGLNQMVYNRCVGTRYCSNNCPYKVRRFNFFDYRDEVASSYQKSDSLELMQNPEVTIRARGVMEKCTFCVQRIMEARQEATKAGRQLKGTDVKTACQTACPADAIVFGDMNDEDSEIFALRNHNLGYHVLEELNVKPNVTYIARLRNKISEDK